MTSARRPRRTASVVGVVMALTGLFGTASALVAAAGPVGASATAGPTTTVANSPDVSVPRMIPLPNSGVAPKYSTDRGGWAQYAVFYGLLASGVIIGGLVYLESRRKLRAIRAAEAEQAAQAAQSAATSTRSEPVAETSENRPESSARQ